MCSRELRQKIQRRKNLEITIGSGLRPVSILVGKGLALLLFVHEWITVADMVDVQARLAYQGDKITARFDANSYVTLSLAMDLVDFRAKHEQRIKSFVERSLP